MRIALLSSTKGSTVEAILQAEKAGKLKPADVVCVLSNKKDAGALEVARQFGKEAIFLSPNNLTREEYDQHLALTLKNRGVKLVALAGWMRILSADFLAHFPDRVLNIHPSLLPKHAGLMDLDVHREVLKTKEKTSGMTIHLVVPKVDAGPIILQKEIAVEAGDTPESLKVKVQMLEKKWYPEAIRQLLINSEQ